MDRRWIIFPAIAVTSAAQPPAMPATEKALRARVSEFFQLQVDKKFRQAETLVATESRDDYYDSGKPKMESFKIQKIELLPGGKTARVSILANVTVLMMGAGVQKFEAPAVSSWKLQNGKWCWYFDKELHSQTPFGKAKSTSGESGSPAGAFTGFPAGSPKAEDFNKGIQADKSEIVLVPGGAAEELTISNSLPSTVQISMVKRSTPIAGLVVTPASVEIKNGARGVLKFSAEKGAQFETFIDLSLEPLARTITLKVSTAK